MSRTSFQIYETLRGDFYTALLRVSTNLTQGIPQQCGSQPPRGVARWALVPIAVTHTHKQTYFLAQKITRLLALLAYPNTSWNKIKDSNS